MPYEQRCHFCGQSLVSLFWDDLESHIMACRERTLPEKRGDLSAFHGRIQTQACDGEVLRKQSERSRWGGNQGP